MTVKATANESVKKSSTKMYRLMPEHQGRPHCCESVMFSGSDAVETDVDLSGFVGILLAEVEAKAGAPAEAAPAKKVAKKKATKKKAAKKSAKKSSEDSEQSGD